MKITKKEISAEKLIRFFNERDEAAFGQVYLLFYDELLYFSTKLFRGTETEPDDVVQDIIMRIWERRDLKFKSLEHIQAYLYVSIRNSFRIYLSHRNIIEKYAETVKLDDDYLITQIVETEVLSSLSHILNLLPAECAKVFKLYLEGWNMKEIIEKLGKAPSTVYNQRQEAVNILKKLDIKKLLSFVLLLSAVKEPCSPE